MKKLKINKELIEKLKKINPKLITEGLNFIAGCGLMGAFCYLLALPVTEACVEGKIEYGCSIVEYFEDLCEAAKKDLEGSEEPFQFRTMDTDNGMEFMDVVDVLNSNSKLIKTLEKTDYQKKLEYFLYYFEGVEGYDDYDLAYESFIELSECVMKASICNGLGIEIEDVQSFEWQVCTEMEINDEIYPTETDVARATITYTKKTILGERTVKKNLRFGGELFDLCYNTASYKNGKSLTKRYYTPLIKFLATNTPAVIGNSCFNSYDPISTTKILFK